MSYSRRRAPVLLLAFWSLLGFLLQAAVAQAHGYGHEHRQVSAGFQDGASRSGAASAEIDEHGHHHTGDPLSDLLTLGHNHVGSACPGLPPLLWVLAAAPRITQPAVPWSKTVVGDSTRDSPFRPPIS
ncbi:MAG: hypothetical protein JNN30_16865 [Rhodanobacteraceae bacterium]|nr:hypothetical protein [Rhodanobacteraceae bacterium]